MTTHEVSSQVNTSDNPKEIRIVIEMQQPQAFAVPVAPYERRKNTFQKSIIAACLVAGGLVLATTDSFPEGLPLPNFGSEIDETVARAAVYDPTMYPLFDTDTRPLPQLQAELLEESPGDVIFGDNEVHVLLSVYQPFRVSELQAIAASTTDPVVLQQLGLLARMNSVDAAVDDLSDAGSCAQVLTQMVEVLHEQTNALASIVDTGFTAVPYQLNRLGEPQQIERECL